VTDAMRFIKITFMDGTSQRYSFPVQAASDAAKQVKIEDFFGSRHVVLASEGRLLVFPMENIKEVEISGGGQRLEGLKLPLHTIHGATPAS
jgi:hypothetical protein